MLNPIIVPESYPSTSFSGATAFVQADGSMGSDESGGSCTIMPWTVGSLLSSSTFFNTWWLENYPIKCYASYALCFYFTQKTRWFYLSVGRSWTLMHLRRLRKIESITVPQIQWGCVRTLTQSLHTHKMSKNKVWDSDIASICESFVQWISIEKYRQFQFYAVEKFQSYASNQAYLVYILWNQNICHN